MVCEYIESESVIHIARVTRSEKISRILTFVSIIGNNEQWFALLYYNNPTLLINTIDIIS